MNETDVALKQWLRERSDASRERLVAAFRYLLVRGARKFYRSGLERADLEQIGAIGFLKACDRYDASLETPFEAFAWLFIVGELMHYTRDHERIVRPPRRLRTLERRTTGASEQLTAQFGRTPTCRELCEHLGIERRELDEVMRYREVALPESLETIEPKRLGRFNYSIEDRDDRIVLDAALETLTALERKIVLALYAAGYRQHELAQRLGYSRRHVSRLHRSALRKMRPFWVPATA